MTGRKVEHGGRIRRAEIEISDDRSNRFMPVKPVYARQTGLCPSSRFMTVEPVYARQAGL